MEHTVSTGAPSFHKSLCLGDESILYVLADEIDSRTIDPLTICESIFLNEDTCLNKFSLVTFPF